MKVFTLLFPTVQCKKVTQECSLQALSVQDTHAMNFCSPLRSALVSSAGRSHFTVLTVNPPPLAAAKHVHLREEILEPALVLI